MNDTLYVRNVRGVTHLSAELKKIIDDYWQGQVPEIILKDYIHYAADNSNLLSDQGKDINITVRLIIGKRRTIVVMKMLESYQLRLF